MFTHCSVDTTKNKLDCCRRKNCIKNLFLDLREYVTKTIRQKEMIPLTKKEEKRHNKQKVCHICKKRFSTDYNNGIAFNGVAPNKNYFKVKDHCHYTGKYRGAAHSICNLRYKTLKEIPVVFLSGSTYDYHFIIKGLAEEFEGPFECLGENTEKYIAISVPIKKQITKKK